MATTILDSYALEQASEWAASRMGLYRQARELAYKEYLESKQPKTKHNVVLKDSKSSLVKTADLGRRKR